MSQTLYIRNMVCNRCIMAVENELQYLAVPYKKVELGEVELASPLTKDQEKAFTTVLEKLGFALLQGKQATLIDKVKSVIIEAIHHIAAGALYPAFGFLLNPMIAGAAMALSSVSVVTNSLRLRSVKI